jgi:hypothetical protein
MNALFRVLDFHDSVEAPRSQILTALLTELGTVTKMPTRSLDG